MNLEGVECWCNVGLQMSTLVPSCVYATPSAVSRSEINERGCHGIFSQHLLLSPVPLASTPHMLSMQAVTLAPASRRQLQPLRDYLCWAPVAAGRSQRRKVTHRRGRSQSAQRLP